MGDVDSDSEASSSTVESCSRTSSKLNAKRRPSKIKQNSIVGHNEVLPEEQIRKEQWTLTKLTFAVSDGMLSCLQWMAKRRLIINSMLCPTCEQNCSFQQRRDRADQYNWTCCGCSFKKSVREGSFFAGSHLSLPTILQLIYWWTLDVKREVVQSELGIKQRHTIVDWYAFIREICARKVIDNPQHIGGLHADTLEGIEVNFGITQFSHSKERAEGIYWVVYGIERGTDRCFMVPVGSRDPVTVLNVLSEYVAPGTILYSSWDIYGGSADNLPEEFLQFAYDYSISLLDYSSLSSTTSDSSDLWGVMHRKVKTKLFGDEPTSVSLFQSYVQESVWRQMYADNHFSNMLADISVYYPM